MELYQSNVARNCTNLHNNRVLDIHFITCQLPCFVLILCMHEKRKDSCAQVTGGKPPQVGQGREGDRIRNFTDSASL